MQLTIVGCGTAAPDGERVCAGYHIAHHRVSVLLDCGPGVVHRMASLGLPWPHLTHLALTHFHNDHVGDVGMLLFALKHGLRPGRDAPLHLLGPKGTRRWLHRLAEALGQHVTDPGFELHVEELGDGQTVALSETLRLTAGAARHTEHALCYRVETAAGSIGYTGDTGPSEHVAKHLQGVHTLISECSLPDDEAMDAHLTPASLAELARTALPKRLVVTHVYPQLARADLPRRLHEAGWHGATLIAHDGMTLEIVS